MSDIFLLRQHSYDFERVAFVNSSLFCCHTLKDMSKRTSFSCLNALEQFSNEQKDVYRTRMTSLQRKISSMSTYEVRDDSRLAFLFCSNSMLPGQEMNEDDVAHELVCIQYICDSYGYHTICESTLRELSTLLKSEYKSASWNEIWGVLSSGGCDAIKYASMRSPLPTFTKPRWVDMCDE